MRMQNPLNSDDIFGSFDWKTDTNNLLILTQPIKFYLKYLVRDTNKAPPNNSINKRHQQQVHWISISSCPFGWSQGVAENEKEFV